MVVLAQGRRFMRKAVRSGVEVIHNEVMVIEEVE